MRIKRFWKSVYANDNTALSPEIWAQEGLMQLENKLVAGNLVYRDFSNLIASKGDVVNASRPGDFQIKRKGMTDDVSVQDASAEKVPVVLNQHIHTSFIIGDAEASKSITDLITFYLTPAIVSVANGVDRAIFGAMPSFFTNAVGQLSGLTKDTCVSTILRGRVKAAKWPDADRSLLLTDVSEAEILQNAAFFEADKVGDNGTAMREASLGRKFGFNTFSASNVPYIDKASAKYTDGAINFSAGYAANTTGALVIDGFSAAIPAGSYVTIGGSMYPYRVTATTGGSTPTDMTLDIALREAILNDAVVSVYGTGAIDTATTYPIGYVKEIALKGLTATKGPQIGQMLSSSTAVYTVMDVTMGTTTATVLLDRPLDLALADDDAIFLGPAGSYNLGFHKNAIALVTRPLATPAANTGVASYVASYNGLSLRVTMTYDGNKQGTLVTVDVLCGVKALDSRLGFVMLG